MAIFERGETYIQQRKFIYNDVLTAVTSAEMTIEYPCSSGATTIAMVSSATGIYDSSWNIPSDATYGEYQVTITALVGTAISTFISSFYILPWNIIQQVRSVSGIKQSNDISDDDIAIICWNAYVEVREDAFLQHIDEKVNPCSLDTPNYYVCQRIEEDYLVCDEEAISGWYIKDCTGKAYLTVTIEDATLGKIKVLDEDGEELCGADDCRMYVSYRTHGKAFNELLFKKALVYLASHEIVLRFTELDKVTLADLHSNAPIVLAAPNRLFDQYKKTMRKIRQIKVGGI